MAIYHCCAKVIGRSQGRSAVGASAYRSGEKIENEKDGIIHDYTKKTGIVYTEIQAPSHAPEWANNRGQLWNEVEKIEKAKNSQLAREVEVALPVEFTRKQQIELVQEYMKENFVDKGMVADLSIHDKGEGNPHAHILLTMRPFDEKGEWGSRYKKEYILDEEGKKIIDKKGNAKGHVIPSTDWNTKEKLEEWRENWAKCMNKHLERNGIEQQVDHRSYALQGVQREPTIHEGYKVRAMEKNGVETQIRAKNEDIANKNKMIELLDKQIGIYENKKEREIGNERRTKDYGVRNENTSANRGTGRGESEGERRDSSRIQHDAYDKNERNRISIQHDGGVVDAIQQKVREVKERTMRDIGESRAESRSATNEQQPVKRFNKSRSFDLDR